MVAPDFRHTPFITSRRAPDPTFYGIVMLLHWGMREHPLAHFHARYGEYEASVEIATGQVVAGGLPRQALAPVQEWAQLHREELQQAWDRAQAHEEVGTIEPLP